MGRWDWSQLVAPAMYLLLFGVGLIFAHSGLQGDQGLGALHKAEALEAELRADLARLEAEHARLQNKTDRLDESFLDLDLLDERARAVLGYVGPDEIVIP